MAEARQLFIIGAALRPAFRRMCFNAGLTFDEQKGLLDSSFRVSGDPLRLCAVAQFLQRILDEEADKKAARMLADIERRRCRDERWWRVFGRKLAGGLNALLR